MATKTISLEIDAYEKLRQAKRGDRESFSSVVRRARWDDSAPVAGEILESFTVAVQRHPEILLAEADLTKLARRRRPAHSKTSWEKR